MMRRIREKIACDLHIRSTGPTRRRVRDVAEYLQIHGVKCRTDGRVHMAESDADQLIRLAKGDGADLIVTGVYGHSWLGEWMFGGMTKGLIDDSSVCLMMSH